MIIISERSQQLGLRSHQRLDRRKIHFHVPSVKINVLVEVGLKVTCFFEFRRRESPTPERPPGPFQRAFT